MRSFLLISLATLAIRTGFLSVFCQAGVIVFDYTRPPTTHDEFKHRRQYKLFDGDIRSNIVGGSPVHPKFRYPFIGIVSDERGEFCAGSYFGENLLITAGRKYCTLIYIALIISISPYNRLQCWLRNATVKSNISSP